MAAKRTPHYRGQIERCVRREGDEMYLVIFEDGTMQHMEQLEEGLLQAADEGIVDVVDIGDPSHPLRYFDEGWCSVDVVPAKSA